MERDFITVVSGLPRSGTSLMMQMLAAGDIPPLTDELRTPDESNPRGYYEFEPVKRLRSDASWIAQARGKAVKIIHILLPELPVGGEEYRVIFMQRPIGEVLASQWKMLGRSGKPGAAIPAEQLAQIYAAQLARAEQWLDGAPRVRALKVDYHAVVATPHAAAKTIATFLERELNVNAMAAAVDPKLHRERGSE